MFFFFKQKTAYEMRISDWSSDVCFSDLIRLAIDLGDDRVTPHCGHEFAHHAAIFMRWLIDGDSLDPGEDTFEITHSDRRLKRLFLEPFSKVGLADGGNDRLLVGKVPIDQIGSAHICTPVTNEHLVYSITIAKTQTNQ